MSDNSFKGKARRQQKSTGSSYMRARREVDTNSGAAGFPKTVHQSKLLTLLGLDPAGTPDVAGLWAQRGLPVGTGEPVDLDPLLRVPLGVSPGGAPVWLDLKDEADGGDGPHGMLVGCTGSGKTTALQSILFSLLAQHSPELLQVMLIAPRGNDFGAFADYPHVSVLRGGDYRQALMDLVDDRVRALSAANAITLEYGGAVSFVDEKTGPLLGAFDGFTFSAETQARTADEAGRAAFADEIADGIEQLLQEREEMAKSQAGAAKTVPHGPAGGIVRYNQVRSTPAGADLPAVPYTVVVVDEMSLLERQDVDSLEIIETLLRKGRTLGINVLLSSHRAGTTSSGPMLTNTQYRIALHVNSAAESLALIGSDDAHTVPRSRGVGLFCRRPGADPAPFLGFLVSTELISDAGRQMAATST